jgi:5'-methylthioadenosine phosphorylase
MAAPLAACAILGGSGLDSLAGLEDVREIEVDTPFGAPSDALRIGRLGQRSVALLARHGRGHVLLPSEINYRANIFALKLIGVERILSASAVGSMREVIRPRDVVVADQFIDRTAGRARTFFGDGVAVHVSLADPFCAEVRAALLQAALAQGVQAHGSGTYLCVDGPAFSTRAESDLFRSWGVDVIGMTNLPEARLAREAEMCYATLALVTDYDCWHADEEDVSVGGVLQNLKANAKVAAALLRGAIESLAPSARTCSCSRALDGAIITARERIPAAVRERLRPILGKYLDPAP